MYSSSALLRKQIEHALESNFPSALTPAPRTIREVFATGIDKIDELLNGGLSVGGISELTGLESSGRTSLALSCVAELTRKGSMCAWVDASDSFDPMSAASCGVLLRRLLWVRCGNLSKDKFGKPWTRLDQAIRVTDLLLHVGGFAAVVLDLGDIAPQHGYRIPLATWFRFRQAADRARCPLVVIEKSSYAQSSAAAILECSLTQLQNGGATVLSGLNFDVRLRRARNTPLTNGARKTPASTWSAFSAGDMERHT